MWPPGTLLKISGPCSNDVCFLSDRSRLYRLFLTFSESVTECQRFEISIVLSMYDVKGVVYGFHPFREKFEQCAFNSMIGIAGFEHEAE